MNQSLMFTALIFCLAACAAGDEGSVSPMAPLPLPDSSNTEPEGGATPIETAESTSLLKTEEEAATFLMHAGFGGTMADIQALVDTDKATWIERQIDIPTTGYLDQIEPVFGNRDTVLGAHQHSAIFMRAGIQGDDQLRQRMVFALSQIFVVSDNGETGHQMAMGYYLDILQDNAFGNFRDLLQEITYSPAMGEYLTYAGNERGDPFTGRMPDENFAREVMQLFTIGLTELNLDGTPKLDANGRTIETYSNDDIVGLAKVFTGLHFKGPQFRKQTADDDAFFNPLKVFPDKHSPFEKTFLGTTIPAGTDAEQSIDQALDHLFEHENVAPFISRQLIQRFTASDPAPDYVERVATVFNAGEFVATNGAVFGTGRRGDLEATIAAILLDESVGDANAMTGKIREPVLKFIHWGRAFKVSNLDFANERQLVSTADATESLGQHPFRSPSVFNFYRPGFVAPGTDSGAEGMTAPEFQVVNEASTVGYMNMMYDFAIDRTRIKSGSVNSFAPNYSEEFELMNDPEALLDHLDLLLTGRSLSPESRADILNAITAMPVSENAVERDYKDRLAVAITMITASPAYAVIF